MAMTIGSLSRRTGVPVSAAGWLATTEGLKVCEYKVVFYTALYSKSI